MPIIMQYVRGVGGSVKTALVTAIDFVSRSEGSGPASLTKLFHPSEILFSHQTTNLSPAPGLPEILDPRADVKQSGVEDHTNKPTPLKSWTCKALQQAMCGPEYGMQVPMVRLPLRHIKATTNWEDHVSLFRIGARLTCVRFALL